MARGRLGSTRIAVLTITPEELDAVEEVFNTHHQIAGHPYYVHAPAGNSEYEIVVREAADRTNTPAGEAVAHFAEHFSPHFFLLIGTAGGVYGRENVALGDVIIADYVDYGEFRKLLPGQRLARKIAYDHPSLFLRENFAKPLRRRNDWVDLIPQPAPTVGAEPCVRSRVQNLFRTLKQSFPRFLGGPPGLPRPPTVVERPKAIEGNIVSTDKIWGDPTSKEQKSLLAEFDKALAFDMESFGVAREIFNRRRSVRYNPQYLVIRGISDFVNKRGNEEQRRAWTPYAARAAAAFAFCLARDVLASPVVD